MMVFNSPNPFSFYFMTINGRWSSAVDITSQTFTEPMDTICKVQFRRALTADVYIQGEYGLTNVPTLSRRWNHNYGGFCQLGFRLNNFKITPLSELELLQTNSTMQKQGVHGWIFR